MKILIAISSKDFSSPTLNAGMKIAKAFSAKTTIVDVGEKINQFSIVNQCKTFNYAQSIQALIEANKKNFDADVLRDVRQ